MPVPDPIFVGTPDWDSEFGKPVPHNYMVLDLELEKKKKKKRKEKRNRYTLAIK